MTKINTRSFASFAMLLVLTLGVLISPTFSYAHNGVDHDNTEEGRIAKMQQIVVLLEYLVELLEHNASKQHMEMDSQSNHTDLSGIHIMPDGSVMLGDGTQLHGATVNHDGMIVLSDGTVVKPAMDMRENHEHESSEEVSIHIEIHDGMTHAHYTAADGTYEEFFVDADVEDEDEVIAKIAAHTGLSEHEVEDLIDFDDVVVWD